MKKQVYTYDPNGKIIQNDINVYQMNWLTYMLRFMQVNWKEGLVERIIIIAKQIYLLVCWMLAIASFPISFPLIAMMNLRDSKRLIEKRHPDIKEVVGKLQKEARNNA